MEAFGAGILIFMMIVFGISALAQAYETSQRWKREEEEQARKFEELLKKTRRPGQE